MFSFQQGFAQPTEPVTEQVFLALVRASRTAQLIDGFLALLVGFDYGQRKQLEQPRGEAFATGWVALDDY